MISIIIPTLNEESVIAKTIQGIKSRLTIPHEVIITDGKSTDRTVEIARQYADKVVAYAGEKRQTIAQGRNDGAKAASGEFLVFMDADCSFTDPTDFFTRALAKFEHDPKLVALAAWISVVPEREKFMDKVIGFFDNGYQWALNTIFHIGASRGEFQMMRRSAYDQLGGYNESLVTTEDFDMFRRLSRIGKTRMPPSLHFYHSGRRAHTLGWPKLLSHWFINTVWVIFTGKSYFKEWKVIR